MPDDFNSQFHRDPNWQEQRGGKALIVIGLVLLAIAGIILWLLS